jgi:N-methylhydantoinase A
VRGGEAAMEGGSEIDRLRIALPMLAIATIGAGGGSLGWIDEGGLLRMGPESAGADPGPACYGRGGERPACTDANVVLGYLDPSYFAGGQMPLDAEAAEPLHLEVEQAAAGMYRVINSNMAHGVREITVKRGLDPREFPMVVAGGAGSLHACAIASELEMPSLVVPSTASVLCATGMLMSDLQHDFLRSHVCRFGDLDPEALRELVEGMCDEGREQLALEGVAPEQAAFGVLLDLRYVKQYHEVTVPVALEAIRAGDTEALAGGFHREHDRLYGYDLEADGTELELINVRVRAIGRTEKPVLPRLGEGESDPEPARKGTRRAFVPERESFEELPVYDGHRLRCGNRIEGPALIERTDTTILVSASFRAEVDPLGSCLLTSVGGGG